MLPWPSWPETFDPQQLIVWSARIAQVCDCPAAQPPSRGGTYLADPRPSVSPPVPRSRSPAAPVPLATFPPMTPPPIPIAGLAHVGIRVHDLERSLRFYALLGFTKTAGPIGPEPVAILDHPSGLEINFILNAPNANEPNVLMDVPEKHAGITHVALLCPDILAAKARLEAEGIGLSGGPVRFGPGAQGIFVRDPDGNVIELHQRG
jgi:lactoylglutathione lyase